MIRFMVTVVFFGSVFGLAKEDIALESPPDLTAKALEGLLGEDIYLNNDGTVLMEAGDALFHWDVQGRLIQHIQLRKILNNQKAVISCSLFDSENGIYWILDEASSRSIFMDEKGVLLGEGFQVDPKGHKKSPYFRQIISAGGRLFTVSMQGVDIWKNPNLLTLNEVSYRSQPEGWFLINEVGAPFCTISDRQRSFDFNFKLHWIVQDPYHKNLYVVEQLTTTIRHFAPSPEIPDDKVEFKKQRIPFSLPYYQTPPHGWNRTLKNKQELHRWWFSWSRINGFYALEKGFLVGYEIPDNDNPDRYRKVIQRISRKGKITGDMREIDGLLLGVHENRVYVWRESKDPSNLSVTILEM